MNTTPSLFKLIASLCLLALAVCGPAASLFAENRSVGVDQKTGIATAVVVDDQALVHTTQLLPFDADGQVAAGDLDAQIKQLVANLSDALSAVESDLTQIARLNVYLAPDASETEVQSLLTKRLPSGAHPAVTYVVTPLADSQALVAVDAIASSAKHDASQVARSAKSKLAELHGTTLATVLPRGRVVYISGMAENIDDLAAATTGTMKQLHGVLKLLGLETKHVVHVKSFLKPMGEVAAARNAIRQMYPAGMSPPMSFVEWSNGLPIEIEMIAFIPGKADANETVQLRWQPEEKRSPVYCRFAVVDSPTRIYLSGLRSRAQLDAEGQVRDIFAQLDEALKPVGSDMRHLVKATYYVAADDVSKSLNEVRPEIYDPERPPAASKASIAGTGNPQRTITVDMIAVPKK